MHDKNSDEDNAFCRSHPHLQSLCMSIRVTAFINLPKFNTRMLTLLRTIYLITRIFKGESVLHVVRCSVFDAWITNREIVKH